MSRGAATSAPKPYSATERATKPKSLGPRRASGVSSPVRRAWAAGRPSAQPSQWGGFNDPDHRRYGLHRAAHGQALPRCRRERGDDPAPRPSRTRFPQGRVRQAALRGDGGYHQRVRPIRGNAEAPRRRHRQFGGAPRARQHPNQRRSHLYRGVAQPSGSRPRLRREARGPRQLHAGLREPSLRPLP